MFKSFIISLLIFCLLKPILSDTWIPKSPACYKSVSSFYFAEIFPAHLRINNKKPMCFFYKTNIINEEGISYDPEKLYSLMWKGELVNKGAPYTSIISPNGYLVTFDEHSDLGYDHSLVIYNKEGKVIKYFSLNDLVPTQDTETFLSSTS